MFIVLLLAAYVVIGGSTAYSAPDSTQGRRVKEPKKDAADYLLAIPSFALTIPVWVLEGVATGPVVLAEESSLPFTLQRLFAFNVPWGVYPIIGYKSRTGLMLGGAYHSRGFAGTKLPLALKATYSTNTYRYVAARVGDRKLFDSNYGAALDIGWRADTRERFYGTGPSSSLDNQSNYGYRGPFGGLTVYRSIARRGEVSLSGSMRHIDPEDGRLQTILHDRDSIASRLIGEDLYGMFETLDLYDLVGTISYDWRERPSSPLGGGAVGLDVGYTFGEGMGDTSIGYWRIHTQASHYFELFNGRVLGISVIAEHIEQDDGTRIPFYDLPKLGGSKLLRGYKTGRFRDLGFVSFAAEYRWPILRRLDALLMTDHGRVFHDITEDFEFSNFRASYGGGLRFWNNAGHLALMAAKGTEEWSFYINFGDSF